MRGAVMCSTERYREFIARLAAERAGLHELQVMRIGRFAAAYKARPLGHEAEMRLVPVAAWGAQREHALVDPPIGAAGWSEWFSSRIYIGSHSRIGRRSRLEQSLVRRFGAICCRESR